jgi:hypothetical protein
MKCSYMVCFNGKARPCGNNAYSLYKVTYSSLNRYDRSFKMDDVFPLCILHKDNALSVDFWNESHTVNNKGSYFSFVNKVPVISKLFGIVSSVEEVFDISAKRRNDIDRQKKKAQNIILSMMKQNNNASLSVQDWDEIFKNALNNYMIQTVLD